MDLICLGRTVGSVGAEQVAARLQRGQASVGDLPTLGDEVLGEEPLVRVVFMKLVGREDAGEHWHSGVELHPHQPADDGVGDELVTVDAPVDDQTGGHDGVEPTGLGEQLGVERDLEGPGQLEGLHLGDACRGDLKKTSSGAVDQVGMPTRLDEGHGGRGPGSGR